MTADQEEKILSACGASGSMSEAARLAGMSFSTFRRKAEKLGCYRPNQGWRSGGDKRVFSESRRKVLQDILSGKRPGYQPYKLKALLFQFGLKTNRCERCGISEWNGVRINCQLHHMDGDRRNNALENLQILCPNCHSQTAGFRTKNRVYKIQSKIIL